MLALLTCLGVQVEGEKGCNANSASVEKVGVNIEAELGRVGEWVAGNTDPLNLVEVELEVGVFELT